MCVHTAYTDTDCCLRGLFAWLQTEIHWYGWIAMTFYICAFIFYMYVRIAYSLDLGPGYIWYGIYLLCVEVLGFTTTIIYGLNLLWNPVIEQFPEDPTSPGRPQVGCSLSAPFSPPPPPTQLEASCPALKPLLIPLIYTWGLAMRV